MTGRRSHSPRPRRTRHRGTLRQAPPGGARGCVVLPEGQEPDTHQAVEELGGLAGGVAAKTRDVFQISGTGRVGRDHKRHQAKSGRSPGGNAHRVRAETPAGGSASSLPSSAIAPRAGVEQLYSSRCLPERGECSRSGQPSVLPTAPGAPACTYPATAQSAAASGPLCRRAGRTAERAVVRQETWTGEATPPDR
jgi:hypothetical protein